MFGVVPFAQAAFADTGSEALEVNVVGFGATSALGSITLVTVNTVTIVAAGQEGTLSLIHI